MAGYSNHDRQRWLPEEPKWSQRRGEAPWRAEFVRDRARVLHSSALRRLAGKTQVVAPGEDDFPRTRLTHSLEVAQIGREIGAALGCDPEVVDAAGLAHDLGHPPFGHNGEDALDAVAASCGGFEGNAQTLRILTRLEAKVLDDRGRPAGLNLTRATLDATCKYPWGRREGQRKFGFYESDRAAFEWIRAGAPEGRRCLEAQVMEWADDVAYSVHDLEDGIYAGHIRLALLADPRERQALVESVAATYLPRPLPELHQALERLLALPPLAALASYDGGFAAQVTLKRATSEIVGRFAGAVVRATLAASGGSREPLCRYRADLVIPAGIAAECALLKGVAWRYVMRRQAAEPRYEQQRRLLTELVQAVALRAPEALEPALRPEWAAAGDDAGRLRVVIDQVARLTDASALSWHARLVRRD